MPNDRKILTLQDYIKAGRDVGKNDIAGSTMSTEVMLNVLDSNIKAGSKEIDKDALLDGGFLTHIASDETLDRHGDIVTAKGWELDEFLKNPVVLWAHGRMDPPIGKCVEIGVKSKKLVGKAEFPSASLYEFANTMFRLSALDYIRGVSVGFMPLEYELLDKEDPWGGVKVIRQSLWEYSMVPIPANPNALRKAANEIGGYRVIKRWAEEVLDSMRDEEAHGNSIGGLSEFSSAIMGAVKSLANGITIVGNSGISIQNREDKEKEILSETADHEEEIVFRLTVEEDPVVLRIVDDPIIMVEQSEIDKRVAMAVSSVTGRLIDMI